MVGGRAWVCKGEFERVCGEGGGTADLRAQRGLGVPPSPTSPSSPPSSFLTFRSVKQQSTSALANFFAACPDNAFQRVMPGMEPFSLTQRMGAILRNGMKLMGVGFCASAMGGCRVQGACWGKGEQGVQGVERSLC